jgi:hypothetical protein
MTAAEIARCVEQLEAERDRLQQDNDSLRAAGTITSRQLVEARDDIENFDTERSLWSVRRQELEQQLAAETARADDLERGEWFTELNSVARQAGRKNDETIAQLIKRLSTERDVALKRADEAEAQADPNIQTAMRAGEGDGVCNKTAPTTP